MHPRTHERPQVLEMSEVPLGPNGKKMTAIERNEWVQLKFDSEFDADSREALKDRIMKATAVKKLAKKDRKAATAAGEAGAAKPKKAKKQKAAPAVGVTTGASVG